jgi:hypothetical protein
MGYHPDRCRPEGGRDYPISAKEYLPKNWLIFADLLAVIVAVILLLAADAGPAEMDHNILINKWNFPKRKRSVCCFFHRNSKNSKPGAAIARGRGCRLE